MKYLSLSTFLFMFCISPAAAQDVSFSADILPVFELRCGECHGEEFPEAGLTLISYEYAMAGSDYGIVINPGQPLESYLIEMIEIREMPQDGDPVTAEELALIRRWIEQGAQDN